MDVGNSNSDNYSFGIIFSLIKFGLCELTEVVTR